MKDRIYIIFNKRGIRALTKRTKKMNALPVDTFMAELNLEVDDKFFANQIPKFDIKLEEGQIEIPKVEKEKQEQTPLALFFSMINKEKNIEESNSEILELE